MVIEESIHINADIDRVWKTFTDLTCWADWNTVLQNVSTQNGFIEEGKKFTCSLRPLAFPIYFDPEIEEVDPCRRVIWTGRKYGISSRHSFAFDRKNNGGTLVTSHEKFSGLLPFVAAIFVTKWRIRNLTVTLLNDLKEAAEAK